MNDPICETLLESMFSDPAFIFFWGVVLGATVATIVCISIQGKDKDIRKSERPVF